MTEASLEIALEKEEKKSTPTRRRQLTCTCDAAYLRGVVATALVSRSVIPTAHFCTKQILLQ